ncbi:hypothetical protein BDQ17DRAFT_1432100 [Cyathus striatus]|nr:hypothetical protein BDQ17DRAFT_1432100 [Cyathus striatus]
MSDGNQLNDEYSSQAGPSNFSATANVSAVPSRSSPSRADVVSANPEEGFTVTELSMAASSKGKTRKSKGSVRGAPQSGPRVLQGTTSLTAGEDRGGAPSSAIPHHLSATEPGVSESEGRVLSSTFPVCLLQDQFSLEDPIQQFQFLEEELSWPKFWQFPIPLLYWLVQPAHILLSHLTEKKIRLPLRQCFNLSLKLTSHEEQQSSAANVGASLLTQSFGRPPPHPISTPQSPESASSVHERESDEEEESHIVK